MLKIFKKVISTDEIFAAEINLVYGATPLSFVDRQGELTLYYIADSEEQRTESRTILIFQTGDVLDQDCSNMINIYNFKFLGSVAQYNGGMVWHIWMK